MTFQKILNISLVFFILLGVKISIDATNAEIDKWFTCNVMNHDSFCLDSQSRVAAELAGSLGTLQDKQKRFAVGLPPKAPTFNTEGTATPFW